MKYLTLLNNLTSDQYLAHLQHTLNERQLLDENRNLSLTESTEQDFLELFFFRKRFSAR
ncbi:hypothetical protein [Peribacillus loiseleuriae]|uniref:hypothetical protein n=1 Tax=Peribacillus loiseleuriae TaxID=1679170 RepID=UPI000AB63047|nr:hypothetical protein [Peribacillus loiseleuriae]